MKSPQTIQSMEKCPLFTGISKVDYGDLLSCLQARKKAYKKNERIINTGDPADFVGIVLSGSIHVTQQDYWGNRFIIASLEPGSLFGEAFSCSDIEQFPLCVTANGDTDILLINYTKILSHSPDSCDYHLTLLKNMLQILAQKNIYLTGKMEHITKKTTREKVLSYLSHQAMAAGCNTFTIPFNRQDFADYLSVERSALSSTLSKMRRDGLIDFKRSTFTLIAA